MSLKILKSLHNKATDRDLETIKALFQNVDQDFSVVVGSLPSELSTEQVKTRYFRQPRDMRPKGVASGTNFNYFLILGGKIKANPDKQAELEWVLGR